MLNYSFRELVDLEQFRELLESHHRLTGMPYAVLDPRETPLIAIGWQDICVRFHRVNPVTCARCRESDAFIKAHLHDSTDGLLQYRCKNNLIDIAIPIVIDGRHLATFFTGQFFYRDDPPDRKFFIAQAEALGFDKEQYLAALDRVPLYSREDVRKNLLFLHSMVQVLAETGLRNLRLAHEVDERKRTGVALHQSEQRYRAVFEHSPVATWEEDFSGVAVLFDELRKKGVTDIEAYFNQHPESVRQCAELAEVVDVNKAALTLFATPAKEELLAGMLKTFTEESFQTFQRELVCLWNGGTEMTSDTVVRTLAGDPRNVTVSFCVCPGHEETLSRVLVSFSDITERKRNEAVNLSRLHLLEFSETHSLEELLEETLNEAEKLTASLIGFYHFVEDDQETLALQNWSTRTKAEFCTARAKGLHYPISEAGVWTDCIRQQGPVIHNDYASLPNRKGMPEGHAVVVRELVVPVYRNDRVAAILGVGNKAASYTGKDVEVVSLLADLGWEIAKRKRTEELLHRIYRELRAISDCNQILLRATDEKGLVNDVCRTICDKAGYCMVWVGYAEQDEARTIRPVAWGGAENGYLSAAHLTWANTEYGQRPCGTAIRTGQTVYVQELATDPQTTAWRELALQRGYQSSISLPLKDEHGCVFGVLVIYSAVPNAFTPEEVRLLEELAGDLAFGITALRVRASRRRVEAALRESEARYRRIVETATEGIWGLGPDCRTEFVNARMTEMLGYASNEILGRPLSDFMFAEGIPDHERRMANRRQGIAETYECRLRRKDGQTVWVQSSATPIIGDGLQFMGSFAMLTDITERKQAEEELRIVDGRYHMAEDIGHLGNWEYDLRTDVLWASDGARCLYGLVPDQAQLSLEEVESCIPERDRVHQALLELIHRGKPYDLEFEIHPRNFREFRTITSVAKLLRDRNGNPLKVVGVIQDVTERKRIEETLALTGFALNNVRESALLIDVDGRFRYVNEEACRALGYSREELLAMGISDVDPDYPAERWSEHLRTLKAQRSLAFESRHRARNGRVFPVEISANYLDYAGKDYNLALVRDITERKRAEEEQAKLRQQFHQAQKMEAIGQLAGGVAHDFNNILGVINGYSEVLLRDAALQKSSRAHIEEILAAGQRAAALTRQLLAFSRKLVLQPEVLSLNNVIQGIHKMLRRLIGEEIEVRTILDPELENVRADAGQMEQVLTNFCINARDAMPGGGSITIETANVEVDEKLAAEHFSMAPGRYVRVSVRDTGIGMNKETLSHVFEPFFTTKGPERGTGLGLATVFGIVKQSGGHVWAESAPGQGSTFSVYLPPALEEVKARVQEPGTQAVLRGYETVLLVEDQAPLRALFRKLVEDNGYTVLEAADGEQAMQVADRYEGNLALLLTDVSLPRIRGPELAEALCKARPGIKVLFMSGHSETMIATDGVLPPGTAFIQKPFSAPELLRKIREAIDTEAANNTGDAAFVA